MLNLTRFCVALAFTVILLGVYTRLKDAGLGCPDWPGCYGELYPTTTIAPEKAWIEMIHRYFAGTLGFCILILSILLIKKKQTNISKIQPLALLTLVIFQGLLGMWTVTLKLLPIVVMGHLLGGFACLTLLWWISLQLNSKHNLYPSPVTLTPAFSHLMPLAIILLIAQIMLGAWTSSNYAALVCFNFPNCNEALWPYFDWQAFNLFSDAMNYGARVTIHMMHRLGALLNFIVLSILILKYWKPFKTTTKILTILLGLQLILGITNVLKMLPLSIAVLHNGVAALLWLSLFTLWYQHRVTVKAQQYA